MALIWYYQTLLCYILPLLIIVIGGKLGEKIAEKAIDGMYDAITSLSVEGTKTLLKQVGLAICKTANEIK